ncbi:hypothetical protein [Variovorax paradoxus]|nr:hypothetical protein INQ48_26460 [Variovorax paradoxus]
MSELSRAGIGRPAVASKSQMLSPGNYFVTEEIFPHYDRDSIQQKEEKS